MRRTLLKIGLCVVLVGSGVQPVEVTGGGAGGTSQAAASQGAGEEGSGAKRALLDRYCVTCHNERQKTAGLMLDRVDVEQVGAHGDVWEKVVSKLRGGAMPPAGLPRPAKDTLERFTAWLEGELDRAATAAPNPGRPATFHRLNRTEYQNAIRDLLAVEGIDIGLLLPADDSSYGFDNMGGTLKLSSTLLERYLSAARKISRVAVGDPGIPVDSVTYRVGDDVAQWAQVDDLPMGTRGGTLIRHYVPVNGEYVFRIEVGEAGSLSRPDQLEVAVDGQQAKLFTLRGTKVSQKTADTTEFSENSEWLEVRLPLQAGRRNIAVTFVQITAAEFEGVIRPYARPRPSTNAPPLMPVLRQVTVIGPFQPSWAADTASRRRVFVCRPLTSAEETPCARTIIAGLARRAYRRPVTAPEVDTLLPFYEAGRREGAFDMGIERVIERIIMSPSFLFRIELDPVNRPSEGAYRVSDVELASRLSFFLWSSIPDDALLQTAAQGKLTDPAELERQVERMLAAPQSQALGGNFAGQWLRLRNLEAAQPNHISFPDFDGGLRQAMGRETELFFASVLREDRSVLDLLTANYTFVNERLARHYGIPNVYGSQFRRVEVTDDARRGLLGHGSVLTLTSYATRTSPVVRGKWILDNLLGTPPPPPPPNVPTLAEKSGAGDALSMREAMVRHRANPACASCHAQMDPLGFALENFDAVGHWRTRSEANTAIDASGALPNGATFEGVIGLRDVLMSQPERFVTTVTEKLLTYALGRGVEYYDMPAVRRIVHEAAPGKYKLSALILGVVKSVPFQMRKQES